MIISKDVQLGSGRVGWVGWGGESHEEQLVLDTKRTRKGGVEKGAGCFLLFVSLQSPSSASSLLLVDVLAADDLVNDPVENVKNEEHEREGHAGHRVNALGPADEQLLHLLDALLGRRRGRGVVVVALDGHAVLGLQAGGAHAVAGEVEAALARLILLQHRPRVRLLGTRERRLCVNVHAGVESEPK